MGAVAQVVLFLVGAIALFSGAMATVLGKSAVHEILAAIYFLIFTVAVMGMGIISVAKRRRETANVTPKPVAYDPEPAPAGQSWSDRVGSKPLMSG